jgi:hypothetical protein
MHLLLPQRRHSGRLCNLGWKSFLKLITFCTRDGSMSDHEFSNEGGAKSKIKLTTGCIERDSDIIMLTGVFWQIQSHKSLILCAFIFWQRKFRIHDPDTEFPRFVQGLIDIGTFQMQVHALPMAEILKECYQLYNAILLEDLKTASVGFPPFIDGHDHPTSRNRE